MKKISLVSFYFPEVKRIVLTVLAISALVGIIFFRKQIIEAVFSEKGLTVLMGLAIAGVAGTVIRIYYRVMIIKYGGKERKGE